MSDRRKVLLDTYSDNPPPSGWCVVEDPVALIEHALSDHPLFVRGENLCRWAEDFGVGRHWDVTRLKSPAHELVEQCPGLTQEEAKDVLHRVGTQAAHLRRPLQLQEVLEALLQQGTMWSGYPSADHALAWLIWLVERDIDEPLAKLVGQQARMWESISPPLLRQAYSVGSPEAAWSVLKEWLRLEPSPQAWPAPPPLHLTGKLAARLQRDLTQMAVQTGTDFFVSLVDRGPDRTLLWAAAQACADVLFENPASATMERVRRLERYLHHDTVQKLKSIVAPPNPGLPAWEFHQLENWYTEKYVPHREWRCRMREQVEQERWETEHAIDFAHQYLKYFLAACCGGDGAEHLSWVKSAALRDVSKGYVHLLIVLDGLAYPDALRLSSEIERGSRRLSLDRQSIALCPLPTVTEFTKLAVARGMPPVDALCDSVRMICSSADEVSQALAEAESGDIVVWALAEPDKTYHFRTAAGPESAQLEVGAQIVSIARYVITLADKVADRLRLRIFITTDHGRLLKNSERTRPVPLGMSAHGRAAWGPVDLPFDASGWLIDEDIAYLHPSRFGLPADRCYAVILSDRVFLTADGRGGREAFPHGGLFPEEVLVPWLEFTRDREPFPVDVLLSGRGEDGKAGRALLTVSNLGPVPIRLSGMTTERPVYQIALDQVVGALSSESLNIDLSPWPSRHELSELGGHLTYLLPDGQPVMCKVRVQLETESLYDRSDILNELGGI